MAAGPIWLAPLPCLMAYLVPPSLPPMDPTIRVNEIPTIDGDAAPLTIPASQHRQTFRYVPATSQHRQLQNSPPLVPPPPEALAAAPRWPPVPPRYAAIPPSPSPHNVAERSGTFRNVALDAECTQSSSPDNASCSFALTNDTATYSHTAAEDQPWFLLDLRKPHWIDSVRLWNRPGYQEHLRDFYLVVSNISDRSRWPSRCRDPGPEGCAAIADSGDMLVRRVEGRFDRRVHLQLDAVG